MTAADRVVVLGEGDGPPLEIVEGPGRAEAIVWPGVGARLRAMHRIRIGPGGATVSLRHPSDAVYAVLGGGGEIRDGRERTAQALESGSMAHIAAGTPYRLVAGPDGIELVGGPAPADPSLYGSAGTG